MPSNCYKALSKAKISLLSKRIKCIPTSWRFSKAKIKKELRIFGRKFGSIQHFRNDEKESTFNPFKNKTKFNSKGKEVSVEIYLSRQKEETLVIDTNLEYYKDDWLTVIKNALEKRTDKKLSLENVMELAGSVLKTTYLNIMADISNRKEAKPQNDTTTKIAPAYPITSMDGLEEKMIERYPLRPLVWYR